MILKQSIKLCPGKKYILKAWTKSPVASANCVAKFYVDGDLAVTSDNGSKTGWVATESNANVSSDDSGKVNLKIYVLCQSSRDNSAAEFFLDDVSLTLA